MKACSSKSTFLRRFSSVGVLGCAIFGAALTSRADYLYWTLDFDYPQSAEEGEVGEWPRKNPTENNGAYVWLSTYKLQDGVLTRQGVVSTSLDQGVTIDVTGQHLDTTPVAPDTESTSQGGLARIGEGGTRTVWNIVDLKAYENDPSILFAVEIGAAYGETQFFSMLYTAEMLEANGWVKKDIETLDLPWNPAMAGGWSVPEPSSGLLMLLGGALMALRRRRRD